MEQNLEVSLAERFFIYDELCKLDKSYSENIVGNIRLEDLLNVVEYSFHVEVFIDVR